MQEKMTIVEFLKKESEGVFASSNVKVQCFAGWYDWFCKDSSLAGKTRALSKKLRSIVGSRKFDPSRTSVMFKNNCPVDGALYDDFRILDEEGKVLFTVVPRVGYRCEKRRLEKGERSGLAEVWGRENDFEEALIEGTWTQIKKWFLTETRNDAVDIDLLRYLIAKELEMTEDCNFFHMESKEGETSDETILRLYNDELKKNPVASAEQIVKVLCWG